MGHWLTTQYVISLYLTVALGCLLFSLLFESRRNTPKSKLRIFRGEMPGELLQCFLERDLRSICNLCPSYQEHADSRDSCS